ncbi:hypothetical protein KAZ01_02580, partial [Candidatus Gracilibacteria bacterium]|nr:hypothetical protein [Candidatus Gracilibacteria bacterium]
LSLLEEFTKKKGGGMEDIKNISPIPKDEAKKILFLYYVKKTCVAVFILFFLFMSNFFSFVSKIKYLIIAL